MTRTCVNCGEAFVASRGNYCGARACQNEKRRTTYLTRYGGTTALPCESCGRPTANGGPKSQIRWCMDPECQKEKRRWIYAARQSDPDLDRIEDRPCSACNCRLPKRPWRTTDSNLGRWCRKVKCQLDRERIERLHESDRRYWHDELAPLTCETCGLDRGVRKGFLHPDARQITEKFVPCTTHGDAVPDAGLAGFAKKDWLAAKKARQSV